MIGRENIYLSNLVVTPNCLLSSLSGPIICANRRLVPHLRPASAYGSADVHLLDRTTKSPGSSYYDPNLLTLEDESEPDEDAAYLDSCPTLVFEIALSRMQGGWARTVHAG